MIHSETWSQLKTDRLLYEPARKMSSLPPSYTGQRGTCPLSSELRLHRCSLLTMPGIVQKIDYIENRRQVHRYSQTIATKDLN